MYVIFNVQFLLTLTVRMYMLKFTPRVWHKIYMQMFAVAYSVGGIRFHLMKGNGSILCAYKQRTYMYIYIHI